MLFIKDEPLDVWRNVSVVRVVPQVPIC